MPPIENYAEAPIESGIMPEIALASGGKPDEDPSRKFLASGVNPTPFSNFDLTFFHFRTGACLARVPIYMYSCTAVRSNGQMPLPTVNARVSRRRRRRRRDTDGLVLDDVL